MENRKSFFDLKTAGIALLVILVLLIFSSKTVYNYNLPSVTATLPFRGKLEKEETSKGITDWAEIYSVYSDTTGKVENVFIEEGDYLQKGQKILQLGFDKDAKDDIYEKLEQLQVSREKTLVDIQSIENKIAKTERYISDLENETYTADEFSDYDIVQTQKEIQNQLEENEKSEMLYLQGIIPKNEYDNGLKALQNLYDKLDNLKKTYNDNLEKEAENIEELESARVKKLLDYQDEIVAYNQDLALKNLDLQNYTIQEESYNNSLQKYDSHVTIYAPENGIVVSVDINKGQNINDGQLVATYSYENSFVIECDISLDNNFVAVNDVCTLSNTSHDDLEGVVKKITPSAQTKKIKIEIESDQISTGETFEITFEKESTDTYVLVPNGTVNMDNDGYYLYQVKRRDGILGKEFYAEKLRIYIGDSDSQTTIVTDGITFFEPIIQLSDKPFSEKDTIKLKNEGDFFAE